MAREYSFAILKNYPAERAYIITKQKEGTIIEKLGAILKSR